MLLIQNTESTGNMEPTEEDVNPYELLGVTTESTDADIRKAYRQRSLKVHPDRVRLSSCSSYGYGQ